MANRWGVLPWDTRYIAAPQFQYQIIQAPMFDRRHHNEKINWVASAIHEPDEFEQRAQVAAQDLEPHSIEALAGLFHGEPAPPAELADLFPGLGQWIAARQYAIFEMFYHFRESALPVLRRVAFGEYDWTQSTAIEVLCRFAAEGIERKRTLAELKSEMPEMRYESLLYTARALLLRAGDDAELAAILDELQQVPEFREAVEEMKDDEE